jgi:hypothetical protein
MNQAIHTIDLPLHLVDDVESIYGYADHLVREIEVEDTAVAVLKFRNGALGTIEAAARAHLLPDEFCSSRRGGEKVTNNVLGLMGILEREALRASGVSDGSSGEADWATKPSSTAQIARQSIRSLCCGRSGINYSQATLALFLDAGMYLQALL